MIKHKHPDTAQVVLILDSHLTKSFGKTMEIVFVYVNKWAVKLQEKKIVCGVVFNSEQ